MIEYSSFSLEARQHLLKDERGGRIKHVGVARVVRNVERLHMSEASRLVPWGGDRYRGVRSRDKHSKTRLTVPNAHPKRRASRRVPFKNDKSRCGIGTPMDRDEDAPTVAN